MRSSICLLIVLSIALCSKACDCIPVHTFKKSMGPNIFLAEVIEGPEFDLARATVSTHETTTVRVLENIRGKISFDTLIIGEGSGTFCLGYLVNRNVGDSIVITGLAEYGTVDIIDHFGRFKGRREFAHLTIDGCRLQSLRFTNGKIHGMITKNKFVERQETLYWLQKFSPLRFLSEETKNRISQVRLRQDDKQQMSLEKLKKLIYNEYK